MDGLSDHLLNDYLASKHFLKWHFAHSFSALEITFVNSELWSYHKALNLPHIWQSLHFFASLRFFFFECKLPEKKDCVKVISKLLIA